MAELRSEKYVNNLPAVLTANTIYYVKTGSTFDMYITNDIGTLVAYPMNIGSSPTLVEEEIDFGVKPITSKRFTITNASATSLSKIQVLQSGNTATGRGSDDWLWDTVTFAAKGNTGDFTLYAKASGRISGKRKILYTINN